MTEHEPVRELLALAAAGALSPEEQRGMESHVGSCEPCAGELQAWQALAQELDRLPGPQAPPELVERTRRLVLAELVSAAERRWNDSMLVFLTLFVWTLGLATWSIVQLLSGGVLAVLDVGFRQAITWLTASTMLAWLTAGVAAAFLGRGRRPARRTL